MFSADVDGCQLHARPIAFVAFLIAIACSLAFCQGAFATDPPVITPGTGVYSTVQATATITGDAGATFYYTTDGSNPTILSTAYSTPIALGNKATIKAIADLSGVLSTVTTANIQNDPTTVSVPRTNLQLWLKPEFIVSSAGSVSRWSDLSGASPSNDATQTTSANQPSLVSGALYGFNGVSFNGASSNSSYLNLPSYLTNLTSGASIFAVVNPSSLSGARTLFTASATGVQDMTSVQSNGTQIVFNVNNGATTSNVSTSSGAVTTGTFQVLDAVQNGSASGSINVNAVNVGSGTVQNLNNISRTVNYIGGDNALTTSAFWGGQVVELLVYSTGVTVTQRAQIEAYLANRYQLSTSLATPAPVISVATGTLPGPTQVAIAAGPNATTYITLDGTSPTTSSQVYSQPVNVYYSQTLKAMSVANGIESSVSSATYTLDSTQWPAPDAGDTTSLQINLQLPTTAIPQ